MGEPSFLSKIQSFFFHLLPCGIVKHVWFFEPMEGDVPGPDGKFRFGNCARCGLEDPEWRDDDD